MRPSTLSFFAGITFVVLAAVLIFSPAKATDIVDGIVNFKTEHGIVTLPEDVTGVLFDYSNIDPDTCIGDTLDLSLITDAFVYPDSNSYNFNQETMDDFQMNKVGLTDVLLKWRVSKLKKKFVTAVEYDTIQTNWQGRTVIVPDMSQYYSFLFSDTATVDSIVAEVGRVNSVIFSEPVFIYSGDTEDDWYPIDDQYYLTGEAWQVHDIDVLTGDFDINPEEAWEYEDIYDWVTHSYNSFGEDMLIGVVEVGFAPCPEWYDFHEPSFQYYDIQYGNEIIDYEEASETDEVIEEGLNHAIAVCSNINGRLNLHGTVGAYPPSKIYFRFFNDELPENCDPAEDVYACIDYGCSVINLSWGHNGDEYSETLLAAISDAISQGVEVVASAGNSLTSTHYPAKHDECIAVSMINTNGQWHSNGAGYGTWLDCCAPGIECTVLQVNDNYPPTNPYYCTAASLDGTSIAAPLVTSVVAWVMTIFDNSGEAITAGIDGNVREIVLSACKPHEELNISPFPKPGGGWISEEEQVGHGLVDMMAAAMSAYEYVGIQDGEVHEMPATYRLTASPNPFNSNVTIQFEIPAASQMTLSVYDIFGRLVTEICSKQYRPGLHYETWNATDYASGLYLVRLETEGFSQTEKIVLLK